MKTDPRTTDAIKNYFGANAANYERHIIPAFRQLARGVITTAAPQGHEITLDVGTGTGILAREIAPHIRDVTGIDFAPEMISAAQEILASENLPTVHFEEADAHQLPYANDHFDLVVSSFGLNATQPRKVFKELRRVLKPGGALVFHEWSLQHRLDTLIIDVMAKYMLPDEDAPDDLFELREFIRTPRVWDNVLQNTSDFEELLAEVGYTQVQVWEDAPVDVVMPLGAFLNYKMAWVNRQAELAAMDDSLRGDCLDALHALLQDEADADGMIHYDPMLFRVRALTI